MNEDCSDLAVKYGPSCGKEQWLKGYIKGEAGGRVIGESGEDGENVVSCRKDFPGKVQSPGRGPETQDGFYAQKYGTSFYPKKILVNGPADNSGFGLNLFNVKSQSDLAIKNQHYKKEPFTANVSDTENISGLHGNSSSMMMSGNRNRHKKVQSATGNFFGKVRSQKPKKA
jgi:hypothetical protein